MTDEVIDYIVGAIVCVVFVSLFTTIYILS
jgi:hypothetical protein